MNSDCELCGKKQLSTRSLRWFLRDYFGVTAMVCGQCYDKVAHDSYGRPNRPTAYRNALKKLAAKAARIAPMTEYVDVKVEVKG